MLNIFVNTWGNYNENGADGGEWITLPMEPEELDEVLEHIAEAMGDIDPEWAIHDYEWTTEIEMDDIDENDDIQELNERCLEIGDLQEHESREIAAAIDAFRYTFSEAMDRQQRGCFIFYDGWDMEDVAAEIADEWLNSKDIPDFIARYFDYEAFARDLSFDGYTETKYGVICDC